MPGSQHRTWLPARGMGLLSEQHLLWLVLGEDASGLRVPRLPGFLGQDLLHLDSATGVQGVQEMAASLPAQNLP